MVILFTADWHLKLGQKNVPLKWAKDRYQEFFRQIRSEENRVDLHIIGGDLFDRLPSMPELELYFNFISGVQVPTIIFDGNHEATRKNKTFFTQLKDASEKLENWKPYGLDEDDDYYGEILFWFNPEIDGIRYIDPPLGIDFPKEIGNTPYAVEKLFDNGSVQADGKINPGISFRTEFAAALLRLQEAANNYAAEQLDFDFGKKYEKPTFECVDLSTSSQIRFILDRQNQIHLLLKKIV